MKPLFERDWEPEGDPRAVVALVHGLGEHSGRYEHVAARFPAAGLAVRALDLRGHGRSPGARGATRFEPAVADLAALVRGCGERGAPVFVYGHSLGALIAALWLVREPAPPVAGAVLSAIGLHSALREQELKVRAARVLGRVVPKVRVKSGIDPATLSRDPAVVALLHGLGEHSGRYEHVAARFTAAELAVRALDLRGHGRSPGPRGATRFEPAVADLSALVQRCGERGAPVFVYGHSLGALIAALWLVREPAPPVAGAVLSAIGLHSALREQAAKVRAARVLGRVLPKARVRSGIDPATLSRDPAVAEAYREDKLVHDTASLGFGLDALEAIDEIAAGAPRLTVPLLVIHGGEDQVAYASGARELAALAPSVTTLHVYDGLFHEIHHEPERDRVLGDVLAWIDVQLGN